MTLETKLQRWKPQIPLENLIIEVNKIYHSYEAEVYDSTHPEVFRQLPQHWQVMANKTLELLPSGLLHILDFGCGTGFAAEQILENIPVSKIGSLVCYDPSKEMLSYCREKISQRYIAATFCEELKSIPTTFKYNLLLTNSLLHHLPQPMRTIREIEDILDHNCVWCLGHEPSRLFYNNNECVRLLNKYRMIQRIKKLLQPSEIVSKINAWFGVGNSIHALTAREVYNKRLFAEQPPTSVIGLLVDYHVAHSHAEVEEGRGFCFKDLVLQSAGKWQAVWKTTYSFMGSISEINLTDNWRVKCAQLAEKYPEDGANFCAVWQRIQSD